MPTIKHQLGTVCHLQLHEGDGSETTYSQITVNTQLRTVAASFRSGADGSYGTTSVVISNNGFLGATIIQPDPLYSPKAELHSFRSFAEYTAVFRPDFPPHDLTWDQMLNIFFDIEIVGKDGETFLVRFDGTVLICN